MKQKRAVVLKNSVPKKTPVVVAVSGGFDPIHVGHVRMFNEAKRLGDKLVVILNNDHWLTLKKGKFFMHEQERKELIESIRSVDQVVITEHTLGTDDISVCNELRKIKPNIFANGGDRKPDGVPVPEVSVCAEIGCTMVYNVGKGGKVQSSSWLLNRYGQSK